MQHDPRGTAITTTSIEAATEFDAAVMALLGQKAQAGARLGAALAADPLLVAGHALAGFALMLAARRPLAVQALGSLARARAALAERGGTGRERALVQSLAAWAEGGDMARAAAGLEAIVQDDPRDILALRLSHGIRFMLGEAFEMRHAIEAALPRWDASLPGYAHLLGCHAFALEETGDAARAEHVGRRAVAMEPTDLWGAHAVAHALGAQGRLRRGSPGCVGSSRTSPVGRISCGMCIGIAGCSTWHSARRRTRWRCTTRASGPNPARMCAT